uniref:Uncharacterized protein n=1 Tax=Ditylenchus dipsaci TaxID=166011 RepID=A0A915EJ31_9BILA
MAISFLQISIKSPTQLAHNFGTGGPDGIIPSRISRVEAKQKSCLVIINIVVIFVSSSSSSPMATSGERGLTLISSSSTGLPIECPMVVWSVSRNNGKGFESSVPLGSRKEVESRMVRYRSGDAEVGMPDKTATRDRGDCTSSGLGLVNGSTVTPVYFSTLPNETARAPGGFDPPTSGWAKHALHCVPNVFTGSTYGMRGDRSCSYGDAMWLDSSPQIPNVPVVAVREGMELPTLSNSSRTEASIPKFALVASLDTRLNARMDDPVYVHDNVLMLESARLLRDGVVDQIDRANVQFPTD